MKIHFVGIGGIGVSALAKYYLKSGHKISGSDLVSSEITQTLKKSGAKILIGKHKAKNLSKDTDLVVYSPAVPKNNPELLKAKSYKLKTKSYPEALGELTKQYFTIAVSGTHGKSTTTCMIALILIKAGLDPTVIVGTKLKEFGDSNFRLGKKTSKILNTKYKILVIEADEHMASFLNYWPKIIVLTTIEADHLDYYKNLGNLLKTFKKYVSHLPKDGVLVANKDDKNTFLVTKKHRDRVSVYFLKQKEARKLKKILKVPGEHNVSNALAALTVARTLSVPDRISFKALSEYKGSWRRFEEKTIKIGNKKITIVNDYAHHPTEIKVTLAAAREKYLYPVRNRRFSNGAKRKIWCVFQPHQYQRTYYLFKDFVKVFRKAPIDKIIITDIYDVAGRELKTTKKKVTSEKLVKQIKKKNIIYLPKGKIIDFLKKNLKGGEVVVIMGAGDIYNLTLHLA